MRARVLGLLSFVVTIVGQTLAQSAPARDGAPVTQTVTIPMTSTTASSASLPPPSYHQRDRLRLELGWNPGDEFQTSLSPFRQTRFLQGALPSLGLSRSAWRSLRITGSYAWLQSEKMNLRKLEDPELANLASARISLNRFRLGFAIESSNSLWSWVVKNEWEQNLMSQSSLGRSQSRGALVPSLGVLWRSQEFPVGASWLVNTRLMNKDSSSKTLPIWTAFIVSVQL